MSDPESSRLQLTTAVEEAEKKIASAEAGGLSEDETNRLRKISTADTTIQENKSRRYITLVTVWVYAGSLLAMALLLFILALSNNPEQPKAAIDAGSELIKVAVLPIVTLVIGYYIGQRRTENSEGSK